jgi:hypothetical protein
MNNDELIEQYAEIHRNGKYGASSLKNIRFIRPDIKLLRPGSIIDYGCGRGNLLGHLNIPWCRDMVSYDPAIPELAKLPDRNFDLLLNIDVLEHIPEAELDPVIARMRSMCRHAIMVVDTIAANAILPNGQNAHATIKPKEWWHDILSKHFGTLYPITVARPWRAAFRTWPRPVHHNVAFAGQRAWEDVKHHSKKLRQKLAGS